MKALISPNEICENGFRVADVSVDGFEVAEPLFWIDCADTVIADKFWYNPEDKLIYEIPVVIQEFIPVTDTGETNG